MRTFYGRSRRIQKEQSSRRPSHVQSAVTHWSASDRVYFFLSAFTLLSLIGLLMA